MFSTYSALPILNFLSTEYTFISENLLLRPIVWSNLWYGLWELDWRPKNKHSVLLLRTGEPFLPETVVMLGLFSSTFSVPWCIIEIFAVVCWLILAILRFVDLACGWFHEQIGDGAETCSRSSSQPSDTSYEKVEMLTWSPKRYENPTFLKFLEYV